MIIKIWKFLLFYLLLTSLTTNAATANILIEKEGLLCITPRSLIKGKCSIYPQLLSIDLRTNH